MFADAIPGMLEHRRLRRGGCVRQVLQNWAAIWLVMRLDGLREQEPSHRRRSRSAEKVIS